MIVAGDIFDTGSPPSYARELYNRFVVELQPTGCQLIVLAGNHDSVATLNESRELLSCLNTRVIATVGEDLSAAGSGAQSARWHAGSRTVRDSVFTPARFNCQSGGAVRQRQAAGLAGSHCRAL